MPGTGLSQITASAASTVPGVTLDAQTATVCLRARLNSDFSSTPSSIPSYTKDVIKYILLLRKNKRDHGQPRDFWSHREINKNPAPSAADKNINKIYFLCNVKQLLDHIDYRFEYLVPRPFPYTSIYPDDFRLFKVLIVLSLLQPIFSAISELDNCIPLLNTCKSFSPSVEIE